MPYTRVSVHYDEDGNALGSADIFFPTSDAAHSFRQTFFEATLDGALVR